MVNLDLKKIIDSNGSLSLSRYINYCLYKRSIGYYQKKKIGTDFTTSPEISQMFGECISFFFLIIRNNLKISGVCELGPGNGTLAKDLIRTISRFSKFKLNFFLYEKTSYLREIQKKILIDSHKSKVNILSIKKLKQIKEPVFFICNEFFDALPVNQYIKKNEKWYEKRVVIVDNKLKLIEKEKKKIETCRKKKYKNGDVIEISPLTKLYLKSIFKHIKNFGGGLLLFDYGPLIKNNVDTIQAIRNSRKSNFLKHPFESDITYHVDFKMIKNLANKYQLFVYGPIEQKKFLFFNGINERFFQLSKLNNRSSNKKERLKNEFERLVDPNGMGKLLKCMFICHKEIKLDAFI